MRSDGGRGRAVRRQVIRRHSRHHYGGDAPRAAGGCSRQRPTAGKAKASQTGNSHVTLHRCGPAKGRRMNRIYLGNVPEQDLVRDRGMEGLPRERIRPCPASLEILTKLSMCMVPAYSCSRERRSPVGPDARFRSPGKRRPSRRKCPPRRLFVLSCPLLLPS